MLTLQSQRDQLMRTKSPTFLLCWSTAVSLHSVKSIHHTALTEKGLSAINLTTTPSRPSKFSLKPLFRSHPVPSGTPATTFPNRVVMDISVDEVITDLRIEHKTEKYKTSSLIVRRGFPLDLKSSSSSLAIALVPAHPSNTADFKYSFTLHAAKPWNGWTLQKLDDGNTLKLFIPANAVVGLYTVQDDNHKIPMAVLFNPFSKEDTVYMPSPRDRDEYVLNEAGRIWRGSHPSLSGMPWNYSQFRPVVLMAAIDLIDSLNVDRRHDPVYVTRHLSAMMNSSDDDNGVIVGRWHDDYKDGVAPTAWTGSHAILKQYWEQRRPVKYGQCWVYSGVFTSILRALGIPATSVTNFDSAHEAAKPYRRVIERYYGSTGEIQDEKNTDSIWNFHVWNMAWMRRPDLSNMARVHALDYDGWQVLDGTPQEESVGLFRLGPGPLNAIKHGYEVDFDTDFVIAEVNADLIYYWEEKDSGKYVPRNKYERHIGKAISMKDVGRDTRQDITLLYKFKEGSAEERASFHKRPTGAVEPVVVQVWDVQFRTGWQAEVKVGSPVVFLLKIKNDTSGDVTVHVNCAYNATDYTGYALEKLGKYTEDVVVGGSSERDIVVTVPPELYEPKLRDGMQTVHFNCSARVKESGQVWSEERLVRLNPDMMLYLNTLESIDLGRIGLVSALVSNPTHMKLTGVVLRVEGEGLTKLQAINVRDLNPGDEEEVDFNLEATDVGKKLLVTTLDTVELMDVARSVHINVLPRRGIGSVWKFLWRGEESENMDELASVGGR